MVIAIDGIAASGKSTIGKLLARRLGFAFLDTGLLYRLVTSRFIECYPHKLGEVDTLFAANTFASSFIQSNLNGMHLHMDPNAEDDSMIAFNKDYAGVLSSAQISKLVPYIAANPQIRHFIRTIQRRIANDQDIVMVGRDIGTVVFPQADYQFFITVNDETRAKRRLLQTVPEDHLSVQAIENMAKLLRERDAMDRERENSPLVKSASAIVINNSTKPLSKIIDTMVQTIQSIDSHSK